MMHRVMIGILACVAVIAVSSAQQPPPEGPESAAVFARFNNMMETTPDLPGTGAYPAVKWEDPWFPKHTLYRPADLGRLGRKKLSILLWGNGGCANDGASGRHHLLEIASQGYLAIAPGPIMSGPGSPPLDKRPPRPILEAGVRLPADTSWRDVDAGLDLAIKANTDPKSPYYQRLDTSQVAVAGHSCGGLQALNVALNDKRIRTVILNNSGIFRNMEVSGGDIVGKADLDRLTVPILYILGGPRDIAYENGMDDFRKISKVPVAVANIQKGHQGTFVETNGGSVAQLSVDWLEWRLRNSAEGGKRFLGEACILCSDPEWQYESKNLK